MGLALLHHPLAIGVERIVDDPLYGIERMIVLKDLSERDAFLTASKTSTMGVASSRTPIT
jgi:hypothetical protein